MNWFAQRRRRPEAPNDGSTATLPTPMPTGPGYYRRSAIVESAAGRLRPEEHRERGAVDCGPERSPRSSFLRIVVWLWIGTLILAGAVGALPFPGPRLGLRDASAQDGSSLWNEREGFRFTNRKAMAMGDLITVVVVESSSGRNRASLSTSKEHKLEMEGGPGGGPLDFIPFFQLDSNTKDELSGDGQVSLSGELRTTITVQVIDIRPNGQLVIEGSRTITLNKEEDRITLRGVARPEDITSDNTILSTKLAEVRIAYDGKGATKRATRPGIIQRIFGWIF